MQSSAASQATISNTRTGLLRFAPVHMLLALFIAMIALGAVAGPVFAQDETTSDTAAAAQNADALVAVSYTHLTLPTIPRWCWCGGGRGLE